MKKKDLITLRQKSIDELKKMVTSKKSEFYNAYALIKASGEKNLKKSKNLRYEISQILTIIREKEIIEEINKEERVEKEASQDKEKKSAKSGKRVIN